MTAIPDLLPGTVTHSAEWWAEQDRRITERAKRRVLGSTRPTAADRAEERDRRRIEAAQDERDGVIRPVGWPGGAT